MNGRIEYIRRGDTSIKVYRDYGNHKTLFDSLDRYNYSDMVSAFEAMWSEIISLRGQLTDSERERDELRSANATLEQRVRELKAEREAAHRVLRSIRGWARLETPDPREREAFVAWCDQALPVDQRLAAFERTAPLDWRTDDETPLGQMLDGIGDEVEP